VSTHDDRPATPTTGQHSREHRYADVDDDTRQADTVVIDRDHDVDEAVAAERWRLGWNSGADLGLLVMRLVVGGLFATHGAQIVFGWFGGPGLDGFANQLTELGFRQADVLSALTGFTALVGGVFVILGLFTPLAAAGLLALAVSAIWVKWTGGALATEQGSFELALALAALAAGLTLTGPGRAALDNGRVWFRHPVATGWFFLLIAAGAVVLVRFLLHVDGFAV